MHDRPHDLRPETTVGLVLAIAVLVSGAVLVDALLEVPRSVPRIVLAATGALVFATGALLHLTRRRAVGRQGIEAPSARRENS